jgi:hypothetical protein
MIDAPIDARHCRAAGRNFNFFGSGAYGYTARAAGVQTRRTTILPEAVRRRQRGSAVFAAESREVEQELSEGIREPRNVGIRQSGVAHQLDVDAAILYRPLALAICTNLRAVASGSVKWLGDTNFMGLQ